MDVVFGMANRMLPLTSGSEKEKPEGVLGVRYRAARCRDRETRMADAFLTKIMNDGDAYVSGRRSMTQQVEKIRASAKNPDVVGEMDRLAVSQIMASYTWFASGLPTVEPSQALAASWALSKTSMDALGDVPMPWPCLHVSVPGDAIVIYSDLGSYITRHIVVYRKPRGGPICLVLATNSRAYAGIEVASVAALGSVEQRGGLELLCRIALGAILEATMYRQSRGIALGSPTPLRRNGRGAPQQYVYVPSRNVRMDATPTIREYCRGGGTPQCVQSLVRGHWKQQAFGIGRTERRFIFVQPYWKGAEDAPLPLRSHTIQASTGVPIAAQP